MQSGTPTAEIEPNDTPATANALAAYGWVAGRATSAATDLDCYSLSLNAGDTVYLSLDLDPERDTVEWNGRRDRPFGVFKQPDPGRERCRHRRCYHPDSLKRSS